MEEEKKTLPEGSNPEGTPGANPEGEQKPISAEDQKSIVNELKALREAKRKADEAKEAAEKALQESQLANKDDVTLKVEEVLAKQARDRAISNKESAMKLFISEHKEFHEDNDPAGIKLQALKNKFAMFNVDKLTEVADFMSVIKDAYALLAGNKSQPQESSVNVNTPISQGSGTPPATVHADKDLSPKELKVVQSGKYSKERLLELKEKRPDFYETIMEYVRI